MAKISPWYSTKTRDVHHNSHWFDVGWTGIEGESSLLFCHACGELRPMALATIEAPAIETIASEGISNKGER